MKRYLLGYLAAWILSLLVTVGMTVASLYWMFTGTPLWFELVFLAVTAMPYILIGQLMSRKAKRSVPRWGVALLLAVLGLWSVATAFLQETALLLTAPGLLLGQVLEPLPISGWFDGLWILLGHLLLPVLYQLGWYWGRE